MVAGTQSPRGSKELSDPAYDTSKHFWKIKDHGDVGWLFLMLLDKVVREKGELRNLISQLTHHINDPRLPCAPCGRPLSPVDTGLKLPKNTKPHPVIG